VNRSPDDQPQAGGERTHGRLWGVIWAESLIPPPSPNIRVIVWIYYRVYEI
jgi:hypothetical protein